MNISPRSIESSIVTQALFEDVSEGIRKQEPENPAALAFLSTLLQLFIDPPAPIQAQHNETAIVGGDGNSITVVPLTGFSNSPSSQLVPAANQQTEMSSEDGKPMTAIPFSGFANCLPGQFGLTPVTPAEASSGEGNSLAAIPLNGFSNGLLIEYEFKAAQQPEVSPNGETKSTIIEILTTALIPDNEPAVLLAEGEKTNPNSDNSAKTTPEQLSKEFSKPQPLVELANTDMSTDESLSFGVSTEKPGRVGPSRENDTESITGRRVSTTVGMNDQVDSQSISSSLNTGEVRESSEILLTHPPVGGAEKTTGDEEKNLRPQGEGSVVELASKPQSKPLTAHALAALSYATPREGPRTVTTELVVDHQVSSPEFAQEVLARAAKELSLLVNDKSSEVRFTLKPESLGELILSIRMEGGKMSAQVDVSNPMVKAALEANIQQLRSDLAVRGIEVQTIEISSAAQSSPRESSGQTPHKSIGGEIESWIPLSDRTIVPPVGGAEKTTGDEEKNLRPQGEGSVVELASKPQSKPLTVHALAALSYATPREGPRTVTTELVVDHQVSSPEFAQEVLARAAKELSLLVNDKSSEVRFTLKPESLGELILSIRMEGGKMSAQVDVSNPMVKAALEANIQQLRSDLAVRGIEVQTIEISSAAQSSPRESSGQTPHKSKSQSRRRSETDSVESYRSARTLGYNTVEFII